MSCSCFQSQSLWSSLLAVVNGQHEPALNQRGSNPSSSNQSSSNQSNNNQSNSDVSLQTAANFTLNAGGGTQSNGQLDENSSRAQAGSILIKNGFLYAADVANTVIDKAWVSIEQGRIVGIGSMNHYQPTWDKGVDRVIDASGQLILPGFVNPHWHESFVAPIVECPDDSDLELSPYAQGGNVTALGSLFGFISSVGKILTLEEGRAIARWSMWTQLRSGTTALGDVGSANGSDAMALAALDLGMRLRVSRWGSDIMIDDNAGGVVHVADTQEQTDDWIALLERWHNHPSGLVGGMPSVMGAFGSSDQQLQALADITQRFQTPYATHLAPLKNERQSVEQVFGCSPIERFDQFGLLTNRLMAVHTAYANEQEYQQLLAAGVHLCHSPAHYGMLGESSNSESGQFGRLLQQGVWLSSSTDGDISFTGGMPEAMRGAHLNHNEALNSNLVCPPTLALKTGSLFGAKALGWLDKIGSLEVGKDADIVLVDVDDYRYRQSQHPLRTFLVTGNSKDVHTVLVRGELVVEAGRSPRFDEQELYQDYQRAAHSARKRLRKPQ